MTVLEVIQRSTPYLTKHGVDSPRLQVELLLAHVLQLPRLQLYLNFERVLKEPEITQLRDLVQKRANRIPIQHLMGGTQFCGLEFEVSPATLIPRPETELLVEQALKRLATLPPDTKLRVLDLGTGSGCIAISMAVKDPRIEATALDASPAALEVARKNAAHHGLENRITFVTSHWFDALPHNGPYDLVASNPPYIPTEEIPTLQPEVRDHDPKMALDGGADGMEVYRKFATEGHRWVKASGWMILEVGDGQSEAVAELFRVQNWVVEGIHQDYSARPRLVVVRPPGPAEYHHKIETRSPDRGS